MIEFMINALVYVGSFLVVLTLVTFVHEWGHFAMARAFGVKVDTFCVLGWGKTFVHVRDKHGVKWGIAPFPVGAYVSFKDDFERFGPSPLYVDDPAARAQARSEGVLRAQSPGVKAAVSVGGPMANFVFAIVIFAILLMVSGRDATDVNALRPQIGAIAAEGAAAQAGLKPGDLVKAIDGRPIATWGELYESVRSNPGRALLFRLEREGVFPRDVAVTPAAQEIMQMDGRELVEGRIGVGPVVTEADIVIERLGPLEALAAGAERAWSIVSMTGSYIANIVTGRASAEHISGPAGIMDMSGQVAKSALGAERSFLEQAGALVFALAGWAAILSVAVGIMNLLPIPVLDGGHIVFYAIEAARGRPVSEGVQNLSLQVGVAAIALLFLFATWNDISRFLQA